MTDQQNAALLPCPFCGDTSPGIDRTVPGFEAVTCLVCGAWIPGETDGTAIAAWNTRPAPAGAEAVREALQLIRDTCGKVCGEFETCNHPSCASSYNAWAIADQALRAKAPSTGEVCAVCGEPSSHLDHCVQNSRSHYYQPTPQPAPTAAEDGLREFVESIVNAMGPYPDLNGHPIISAAYAALRAKPKASTEKGE